MTFDVPPEVFNTTLPEIFADRCFFTGDAGNLRMAFGIARPDGSIKYDVAVRTTPAMINDMILLLQTIRDYVPPAPIEDPPPAARAPKSRPPKVRGVRQ